jgi:cell division protein FtsZ
MLGMGYAMMGTATAKGDNALVEAAKHAISCPMLDDGGVKGARAMLINITGSSQLGLHEVNEACGLVRQAAEYEDVQINFGIVVNEAMKDEVKITVIATGFQRAGLPTFERKSNGSFESSFDSSRFSESTREIEERAPEPEEVPVAASAPPPPAPVEQPKDDLEMPAFLRRDRRLFQ